MGSNGVKSKVVLMVLIAGTVPVVLFSLAVFAIDSGPGRLAVTVAFVLLMAAGSYITARRVIELLHSSYEREKELEMQIIKKDKLAAIGLLTAGIAHELNTPLASALLNTQMLKEDAKKEWPDRTPVLDSIEEEIKRAGSVVRNILDFSRQTQVQSAVTDVNSVLTKLLDISSKLCSEKGILIRRDLHPGIPLARGNGSILHQVFMNIVSNAIEAMDNGGTLSVFSRFLPGQHKVVVDIEDTGPGISREHIDGVFDPFFTTKASEDGTGLGLAISYSMVRKMGGDIRVVSSSDERENFPDTKGTIFSIELPALEEDSPRNQKAGDQD